MARSSAVMSNDFTPLDFSAEYNHVAAAELLLVLDPARVEDPFRGGRSGRPRARKGPCVELRHDVLEVLDERGVRRLAAPAELLLLAALQLLVPLEVFLQNSAVRLL